MLLLRYSARQSALFVARTCVVAETVVFMSLARIMTAMRRWTSQSLTKNAPISVVFFPYRLERVVPPGWPPRNRMPAPHSTACSPSRYIA